MINPHKPTGRHRADQRPVPTLITRPATLGRRVWLRGWALITITCLTAATTAAASWLDWLAYWPGLAVALTRVAAFVRTAARTGARGARRLVVLLTRTGRQVAGRSGWSTLADRVRAVGQWLRRWAPIVGRRAGRVVGWTLVRCGRGLRWARRQFWRWAEPYLRDAAGWLVHTAPRQLARWAGRMLLRFLRWAPVMLVRLLGWSIVGVGWLVTRIAVYCATYPEYAGMIREARELDKPRRVHALQTKWRRTAARRTGFFLVLGLLSWLGWTLAVDTYGSRARLVILTAAVVGTAIVGRIVKPPKETEPPTPDGLTEVDENAPYPITDAHTRAEAADCVARALAAENIQLRMTGEAKRTAWGWEVPVILRAGTPAGIVAKTGDLETHLDLPAGGVLATPDRTRRARVVLRLAERDPFLGLGTAPARPPGSLTITERAVIGRRIDGAALAVPLLGVHGVVIGSSGSGKSNTLLALADVTTACVDAVTWDLDPAGDGLRALGGAVARRERDMTGIEDALADAVALAEARPKMLAGLGMGAAWQPARERPAVVLFCDEYPRLSTRAKDLAVHLLRIGRKARVSLILAATEATSDALGAAVADATALKILHACRNVDVRLVLGPQMTGEGWRPDRLNPSTADDPGDAGKCYVSTAGHREPLVSKIAPVPEADAEVRGDQRTAAGLPRIDADSWERARARRAAGRTTSAPGAAGGRAGTGRPEIDRQAVTDVLTVCGADARLWTEEILSRLSALDDRYTEWTGEDLAAVLRPLGVTPAQVWRQGRNRNGYDRDAIQAAFQAWRDDR